MSFGASAENVDDGNYGKVYADPSTLDDSVSSSRPGAVPCPDCHGTETWSKRGDFQIRSNFGLFLIKFPCC